MIDSRNALFVSRILKTELDAVFLKNNDILNNMLVRDYTGEVDGLVGIWRPSVLNYGRSGQISGKFVW